MSWYVYLLATVEEPVRTYVGATLDVDRRLQQHNGQKGGGARATARVPGGWYRVCYIKGFSDKREALRFEWWWKRRSALFKKKCAKSQKESVNSQKKPLETQNDPVKSQKDPVKSQKEPVKSQKDPVKSQKDPVKSQKDPVKSQKEGPLERRQRALEALISESDTKLEIIYE
jgi:predicted GIY-YIG superfamily endonuclease